MKRFAFLIAISFLLASYSAAGADRGTCIGGSCMRPGAATNSPVTPSTSTIVQPSVQGSSAATCGARTPKGSTPRGRVFRVFRRWR